MTTQSLIDELDKEWDDENGFFGRLRSGFFDQRSFEHVVQILQSVKGGDTECLDRRLVSLTWYIPLFMSWQRERVEEQDGNIKGLDVATNKATSLLEEILGVP